MKESYRRSSYSPTKKNWLTLPKPVGLGLPDYGSHTYGSHFNRVLNTDRPAWSDPSLKYLKKDSAKRAKKDRAWGKAAITSAAWVEQRQRSENAVKRSNRNRLRYLHEVAGTSRGTASKDAGLILPPPINPRPSANPEKDYPILVDPSIPRSNLAVRPRVAPIGYGSGYNRKKRYQNFVPSWQTPFSAKNIPVKRHTAPLPNRNFWNKRRDPLDYF